ncbi:hypothetical protein R83H12_00218 [Fibrobacteria bacterium R8-3-H12]
MDPDAPTARTKSTSIAATQANANFAAVPVMVLAVPTTLMENSIGTEAAAANADGAALQAPDQAVLILLQKCTRSDNRFPHPHRAVARHLLLPP